MWWARMTHLFDMTDTQIFYILNFAVLLDLWKEQRGRSALAVWELTACSCLCKAAYNLRTSQTIASPAKVTHHKAIRSKGIFIWAKFLIRLTIWPAPANSHFSSHDSLGCKIPPSCHQGVNFLSTEHLEPFHYASAHLSSGGCECKGILVIVGWDSNT